jgi:hypothetical protein
MNNKLSILIIIVTFLILLIPFTLGELPTVKKGSCVSIPIPYNASWINVSTITYPNQTMILLNVAANQIGNTFYYNNFCDTQLIGVYTYQFFASDGFSSGNTFEVSPNGDLANTSQALFYIILLLINLLALTFFIIISIKAPYNNKKEMTKDGPAITKITKSKYIKLLSIWISYGLYLWFITIITGMVNNYISFNPLKDMTTNLFIFSSIIGYCLSLAMIFFLFFNLWKDILLNKTIIREGKAIIESL